MVSAFSLQLLDMFQWPFPYGKDIKAYLIQFFMIKEIPAVKQEGGFFH
jgi:hypothetical protein